MVIVKWLIVFYLGLLPLSAWVYRQQMPKWSLALYACPLLLCLFLWQTSWGFLLGLTLACGVRVLGGRLIFGENHLSHFLSHLAVSLVLALGLFMF